MSVLLGSFKLWVLWGATGSRSTPRGLPREICETGCPDKASVLRGLRESLGWGESHPPSLHRTQPQALVISVPRETLLVARPSALELPAGLAEACQAGLWSDGSPPSPAPRPPFPFTGVTLNAAFLLTVLLKYKLHAVPVTHLKRPVQWLMAYSQR